MNILFYSRKAISSIVGGTERKITSLVSNLSRNEDVVCYSLYTDEIPKGFALTAFRKRLRFDFKNENSEILEQFICENNIKICLCFGEIVSLSEIVMTLRKCKNIAIVCNHTYFPRGEANVFDHHSSSKYNLKELYKAAISRYRRFCYSKWLSTRYNIVYQLSNQIVVMTQKHKNEFIKFGKIAEDRKFTVIPNVLSYNKFFDMSLYAQKKKEVLIVSRLSEIEKHILLSLRIWEFIEKETDLNDWHLTIVGHGYSEQDYKDFVKQHHLQRVSFEGKQDPQSYYERASIFMMTSPAESWGNTLTEAQQFACVPIAFDSLIALPIIVSDGVNGYAIPANSIRCYKKRLVQLMTDSKLREKLAGNAVESSHRFEQEKIMGEWYNLMKSFV